MEIVSFFEFINIINSGYMSKAKYLA
jgi:hypothetical protein